MKRITLLVICIFLAVKAGAQDTVMNQQFIYPDGLSIEYGIGKYAVKDEYISYQKYSGNIPYFSLKWSRFKDGHGLCLGIESRNSSYIFNNDIACKVTQNTLNQDFFYSIDGFNLFKKNVQTFLGPSVNILLYSFNYDFGTYNNIITESHGSIVSLGINAQFHSGITKRFFSEEAIHLSLASICSKSFQSSIHDEAEFKFLLAPKGMNTNLNVGLRFYIFSSLSVKAGYKLQLFRIDEWDPVVSLSNNLIFSISYHFKKGANHEIF